VTELVPVAEWLAQKEKNMIMLDPEQAYPPRLPRYQERDHLHDNTRAHAVFDPANPGLTTYIRITRRVDPDPIQEEERMERRRQLREADLAAEAKDAKEKNEILELRSLGLRTAMKKYADLNRDENDAGRAHTHGKVSKATAGSAFFM